MKGLFWRRLLYVLFVPFLACYRWRLRRQVQKVGQLLECYSQSCAAKKYDKHKRSVKERAKILEPAIVSLTQYHKALRDIEKMGEKILLRNAKGKAVAAMDIWKGRALACDIVTGSRAAERVARNYCRVKDDVFAKVDVVALVPRKAFSHLLKNGDPGSVCQTLRRLRIILRFVILMKIRVTLDEFLYFCKAMRDLDQEALVWEKRDFLEKRTRLEQRVERLQRRLDRVLSFVSWLRPVVEVASEQFAVDPLPASVSHDHSGSALDNGEDTGPCLPYAVREEFRNVEEVSESGLVEPSTHTKVSPWRYFFWKNGPDSEVALPFIVDKNAFLSVFESMLRSVMPGASTDLVYDCLVSIVEVPVVERGRKWKTTQHAEPTGWFIARVGKKIRILFDIDDAKREIRFLVRPRDKVYRKKK